MSAIKKVILVGVSILSSSSSPYFSFTTNNLQATGNLGPAVLTALQDTPGLEVAILTRENSKTAQSPPKNTKVLTADYDSVSSVAAAFAGQDAVVSTIASAALSDQQTLIDAAVQAGVKRFIPSEFGSNVTNEKARGLAVFAGKIATVDYLKKKEGEITWSALLNGGFLDWGLLTLYHPPLLRTININ